MSRSHIDQLLSPLLTYWRVRFTQKHLTTVLSAIVAFGAGGILLAVPQLSVAGERGLVAATLPLLSLLVGFYVAALGITATLSDRCLDYIPDNPPVVRGRDRVDEELTWRRFLGSLFGFLVSVALMAHLLGVVIWVAAPVAQSLAEIVASAHGAMSGHAGLIHQIIRASGGAVYTGLLCLLGTNTLFGVFMLSERYLEERDRIQMTSREPAQSRVDEVQP